MNKTNHSYKWIVFTTVLFAYFLVMSQRTAPGLITDQLMTEFHVSAVIIGLMSSFQYFAYAGFQIPVGFLADKYEPNRFLILGLVMVGVGCVIYSFSPNEWVLIGSRFFVGVGDAMIFVNLVLILGQWFQPKEFTKVMGFIGLTAALGTLTSTAPIAAWISLTNWQTPFFFIGLFLAVYALFLYRILIVKPKKLFTELIDVPVDKKTKQTPFYQKFIRILSTKQAWAVFLCNFSLIGTHVGFISSWGVSYGMELLDLSRQDASVLMMLGLCGGIVGGPFMGWIASRLSSVKPIFCIIHGVICLSWFLLFAVGTEPNVLFVVLLLFVFGFGNGAGALIYSVVRNTFAKEDVGLATSFATTGGFASAILLPIAFGFVLSLFPANFVHIGYHYAILVPFAFSLLGVLGVCLIREQKVAN